MKDGRPEVPGVPLLKKLKKDALVAFGPFLIGGMVFALLWGQEVITWYQGLLR